MSVFVFENKFWKGFCKTNSALKVFTVDIYLSLFHMDLQVLVTSFGEIDENDYLDPRTAQVVTVDHVKQVSYFLKYNVCIYSSVYLR